MAHSHHALPLKNTVALVNAFVVNTTKFLNHFSALAEEKLANVSSNVSRLEKVLLLLETKLYRPDADDGGLESKSEAPLPALADAAPDSAAGPTFELPEVAAPVAAAPAPPPVEENPAHEPFKRMLKMGVPRPAVEQKMTLAGLDPNEFPWPQ